MATYKTPDVYVEEISVFPPSIAEVETAVPAFIGYTEKAKYDGTDLHNKPTKITSLIEYHERFGFGPETEVDEIVLTPKNSVDKIVRNKKFMLYDSLQMFFANGGGKCYIVSAGTYKDDIKQDPMLAGIDSLKKEDEPTMLVFPDGVNLEENGLYSLQQKALAQAAQLMDRFVIMDTHEKDGWEKGCDEFRNRVGINNLKYGAVYTPHLVSTLTKNVTYRQIKDKIKFGEEAIQLKKLIDDAGTKDLIQLLEDTIVNVDRIKVDGDSIIAFLQSDKCKAYEETISNKNSVAYKNYLANPTLDSFFNALLDEFDANLEKCRDTSEYATVSKLKSDKSTKEAALKSAEAAAKKKGISKEDKAAADKTVTDLKTELDKLNADIAAADQGIEISAVKDACRNLLLYISDTINEVIANWVVPENPEDDPMSSHINTLMKRQIEEMVNDLDSNIFNGWTDKEIGEYLNSLKLLKNKWGEDIQKQVQGLAESTEQQEASTDALALAARAIDKIHSRFSSSIENIRATSKMTEENLEQSLKSSCALYSNIINKVIEDLRTIPPSGVMAGVYTSVDNSRGVWKAPANVSLNNVMKVTQAIDNNEQADLNVDVVAGKSINAIRPFQGKGILVWGGRTLMGNDNEWRYISVRRFFNMVEESIKKSTYWAVFEPNDANLWVKIKAMIENYLVEKWKEGALAGASPEQAFYVNVGLGQTMTAQDVLEGRLYVDIGMAVVRPAEFIVLRFMHKMQES
ncbi:MAG: phage tail sheath subtilisin-like domain-containing protein [Lentisphaeraceae bacterium]|nr:phage tail sheath subtilisin-like domain-containing protein [Lentisphaeraceae bacterium]